MERIRVMVTSGRRVEQAGVAQIINTASYLKTVGRKGSDVLEEAVDLQPDLLIYELVSTDEMEYKVVKKLKESCKWTKVILFSNVDLSEDGLKKFFGVCNGYLRGPVLPGFLLKAINLACYSGKFFFLGPSRDIECGPEVVKINKSD